jgi:hypothetical protein
VGAKRPGWTRWDDKSKAIPKARQPSCLLLSLRIPRWYAVCFWSHLRCSTTPSWCRPNMASSASSQTTPRLPIPALSKIPLNFRDLQFRWTFILLGKATVRINGACQKYSSGKAAVAVITADHPNLPCRIVLATSNAARFLVVSMGPLVTAMDVHSKRECQLVAASHWKANHIVL